MTPRPRSLLPAVLLLAGCRLHHRAVVPEPARGPTRDSLYQLDQSRGDSVAARGSVDGALAFLASDVVFLRAGVPAVYGRDAVRALVVAGPRSTPGVCIWQPLGGGVSRDLRSAYTFGIAARPEEGGARLERYAAFWGRDRDQPWRILAYIEINAAAGRELPLTAAQISPPARRLSRPRADLTARVRSADSLFADLADRMGTPYAFSKTVAPYGAVFGGAQLVVGPAAVKEFFSVRSAGTAITWQPVFAEVSASGDLGFTTGDYIRTGRGPSGAAVQRFGKYLTIWQREPDGAWKFVMHGENPTPARAER